MMGIIVIIVLWSKEANLTIPVSDSLTRKYEDKWFTSDKYLHFYYSVAITGLSYHLYHCQFNNPNPGARYFSISLASVTGIGKELYDKYYRKGKFSYKDLTADVMGIIIGALLFTR